MPDSRSESRDSKRPRLADRGLSIALVALVLGALAAAGYTVAKPYGDVPLTEFYIVGHEGEAADYPETLILGERGRVVLGLVNHEGEETEYTVGLVVSGRGQEKVGPVRLASGETWEQEVSFLPKVTGDHQKIEFLLYKGSEASPYLSLHLWVDVEPERQPGPGHGEEEYDPAGA